MILVIDEVATFADVNIVDVAILDFEEVQLLSDAVMGVDESIAVYC